MVKPNQPEPDLTARTSTLLDELASLIEAAFAGDTIALRRVEQLRVRLGMLIPDLRKSSTGGALLDFPGMPTEAPELWKKRKNKDEEPIDFIQRVYAQWLGKGLARPHIRQLDLSLYNSLYFYHRPDEISSRLDLPRRKDALTKKLAEVGTKVRYRGRISDMLPQLRQAARLGNVVRRRAQRARTGK